MSVGAMISAQSLMHHYHLPSNNFNQSHPIFVVSQHFISNITDQQKELSHRLIHVTNIQVLKFRPSMGKSNKSALSFDFLICLSVFFPISWLWRTIFKKECSGKCAQFPLVHLQHHLCLSIWALLHMFQMVINYVSLRLLNQLNCVVNWRRC